MGSQGMNIKFVLSVLQVLLGQNDLLAYIVLKVNNEGGVAYLGWWEW